MQKNIISKKAHSVFSETSKLFSHNEEDGLIRKDLEKET